MKARWTSNSEDQRRVSFHRLYCELLLTILNEFQLVIAEARKKIVAMSKSDNPVWQTRNEAPANFHHYQVITPAEEERIFKEAMGETSKSVTHPVPVSK